MKTKPVIFCFLSIFVSLLWLELPCSARDFTIVPSIETRVVYDDNLDFDSKDAEDDFGANAIPRMTLNYATELLQVSLIGEIDVLKYFNQTKYDRTNYLSGFDGRYRMFPRWTLAGDFEFRQDETVDSQLEETGQAFDRDKVRTYDAGGGLFYKLTELSDIGLDFEYRKRDYSDTDDNTNFDRYTFSLPYTRQLANQRDTLSLIPSYTIFDSDAEDANDYRFVTEWERKISETLTSQVHLGVRYTDLENQDNNDNDKTWGGIGKLGLKKIGETFTGEIAVSRDIRANSNGEIVEVNHLLLRFDKELLERFGFKFYGSGYLTDTESSETEDQKTTYFELKPSFYYLLTENHSVVLAYEYQNEKEFDEPGKPLTQRNKVWLGFKFKFPKKIE